MIGWAFRNSKLLIPISSAYLCKCFIISALVSGFSGYRVKRQEAEDEEELERALCKDKGAGEWFRLEQGEDKCRDVIQCTASVSFSQFIQSRSNIGAHPVSQKLSRCSYTFCDVLTNLVHSFTKEGALIWWRHL